MISTDDFSGRSHPEKEALEAMVDAFAAAMNLKLFAKQEEGYSGWDAPHTGSSKVDWDSIKKKMESWNPARPSNCVDIANYLAMIWNREQA